MAWLIKGEYFENCTCDVLCPCLTSAMDTPGDGERCQVPFFVRIDEGYLDDVRLDGLHFVMLVDSPARMADANWRVGLYLDERADERQRAALEQILWGELGGMPELVAGLSGERLGVKVVPIEYSGEGNRRVGRIPGIADFDVENIVVTPDGGPITVKNVFHPFGSELPISKSHRGVFDEPDWGLSFDNTGRNGHITEFAWQG